MSDAFYNLVWYLGWPAFWSSSSPTVLHADRAQRVGPFILAANHTSPFDIPLLMRHVQRHLDFVSIVEVFRNPIVGWFYGSMNAFPLDRSRRDSPTVRIILDRLARGRVVTMFPEGGFRQENNSVLNRGAIRSGIGRIAMLASVPIVPVVIRNSAAYWRATSWLPYRRTRYGLNFGEPLLPPAGHQKSAADDLESRLVDSFRALDLELQTHGTFT